MAARYALYFAPEPGSALHAFGSSWLGRDTHSGAACDQPVVDGISPKRLVELTGSPRRYGFHATLKAPFRLAEGCNEPGLRAAVAALVAGHAPFEAPALRPAEINGWRALVLSAPCPPMQLLCDKLVAGLDRFRAPPTEQEIARRVEGGRLSERQRELFERWGYPHVFGEFRFHMTLTEPLEPAEGRLVDTALARLVQRFTTEPLSVPSVALFHQPAADAPFTAISRFRLGVAPAPSLGAAQPSSTSGARPAE